MSEEMKREILSDEADGIEDNAGNSPDDTETALQDPSDAENELSENYRKLPAWKQVVLLIIFLGGMTAVIMIINFIVEFGAELIKALIK